MATVFYYAAGDRVHVIRDTGNRVYRTNGRVIDITGTRQTQTLTVKLDDGRSVRTTNSRDDIRAPR
jgi:hypothetical protein